MDLLSDALVMEVAFEVSDNDGIEIVGLVFYRKCWLADNCRYSCHSRRRYSARDAIAQRAARGL